jgi:quinolinate synthase
MHQPPLPVEYTEASQDELNDRIQRSKDELGERLVILGHHYQRDEIIRHADFRGDSYKLAKDAAAHPKAESIVFCGVHFMAESADILTPDSQRVILPNLSAGCSMADMANVFQVRNCWRDLEKVLGEDLGGVVPITYINSAANLKAFVGEHGGTVCTSSNATTAVRWALEHGERVLFFPDQHLGRNTGFKLGYDPKSEMCVWDPFRPLGRNTEAQIRSSKFILWKGHCSVHQRFTVSQIEGARAQYPRVTVMVHPECPLEVVQAADLSGSTEAIIRAVVEAPSGSVWAVGTEINLVHRLANENPDKTIFCLDPQVCPCSTMYRIHPSYLCWTLDNLVKGEIVNQISVPDKTKAFAREALNRMLTVCA